MIVSLEHSGKQYNCNLKEGIDLSSTLAKTGDEIRAWYVSESTKKAVEGDGWIGSVKEGSPVNFYNIAFNPHGNGTHTEGFGHISKGWESVNDQLKEFHFIAHFVILEPKQLNGDWIIDWESIDHKITDWDFEALIVKAGNYSAGHDFSHSNPPYFDAEMIAKLRDKGIKHILTDLPSVDKEEDEGKMSAHKAWWNYPEKPRAEATISELLCIVDSTLEGKYLLNLQMAPFHNDASPSRPVIYPLKSV